MHAEFSELARWANFYVIVGSSAGALTGLQFVVITLVAQANAIGSRNEIRVFATPTVVHFCAALILSAMMSGPWGGAVPLGICIGVFGAASLIYFALVLRHARKRSSGYAPDAEDWFWYFAMPLAAYGILAAGGFLLLWKVTVPLWLIGAITLLLVLIGIRNAWDTVTFVALGHQQENRKSGA